MNIIGRHPYSFLFAGAGAALLAIVLFAHSQSALSGGYAPSVSISAGNTLINPFPSGNPTIPEPPAIIQSPTNAAPYIPIVIGQTNAPAQTNAPVDILNALNASAGARSSAPATSAASDQLLQEVYSLIPSGVALPLVSKPRSAVQQALYGYGNTAGRVVLAFDDAHPDMAQVLKDWLADRGGAAKIAGVRSIALDMQKAGQSLGALSGVPPSADAANQALAKGYKDAGDKLLSVAAAGGSDSALVEAIETYDTAADSFTGAYVSLAGIFSLSGVTFSTNDPGSAFEFSF